MIEVKADLWGFYQVDKILVAITINGFVKKDGNAVMGKGCAYEASLIVPDAQRILGSSIRRNGWDHIHKIDQHLAGFPVKRDKAICDGHNVVSTMRRKFRVGDRVPGWALKSETRIIANSLRKLFWYKDSNGYKRVFLPRPGCGAGELSWDLVKPICAEYGDWLIIVHKE